MKTLTQNSQVLQRLYNRNLFARKKHVEEKVRRIIEDVRLEGDEAVLRYTKRFDKASLVAK